MRVELIHVLLLKESGREKRFTFIHILRTINLGQQLSFHSNPLSYGTGRIDHSRSHN